MLDVKLATAYVEMLVERKTFDRQMKAVVSQLRQFQPKVVVDVKINTTAAFANLNALMQRLKAVQTQAAVAMGGFSKIGGGSALGRSAAAVAQKQFTGGVNFGGSATKTQYFKAMQQAARASSGGVGLAGFGAAYNQAAAARKAAARAGPGVYDMADVYDVVGGGTGGAFTSAVQQAAGAAARRRAAIEADRAVGRIFAAGGNAPGRFGGLGGGLSRTLNAPIGGARGGFGGPGFLTGAAQGLGLPFVGNPAALAGMTTVGGAASAIRTAAGLQTEFADLRRVTGLTAEEMDAFKQRLFSISTTQAGVSMGDLTEIAGIGGRMGIVDKEGAGGLETFTRQVAQVKNAITDIPTEVLANSMGRVLSLFNLGTDRISGFGSALTAMDNISTASAKDILEITTALSGTASTIGLTLPQVLAFSSALKDAGLSNQLAGSSFSQIFRKMAGDSANFARMIGVDAQVFKRAYETDVMGALGMVIARFKEMATSGTTEQIAWLNELGFQGVRTAGSFQQLAAVFDQVEGRSKVASEETGSLAALTAASALKAETAQAAFQKFENAVTKLGDSLAKNLLPALTDTVNLATILANTASGEGMSGGGMSMKTYLKSLTASLPGVPQWIKDQMASEAATEMQTALGQSPEQLNKIQATRLAALAVKNDALAANALIRRPAEPSGEPSPGHMLLDPAKAGGGAISQLVDDFNAHLNQRLGVGKPATSLPQNMLPQSSPLWFTAAQRKLAEESAIIPEQVRRQARVGISGAEVGRQLQEDVLSQQKDDAVKKSADTLVKIETTLNELLGVTKSQDTRVGIGVLAGP